MKRDFYYIDNQNKLLKQWQAGEWRIIFGYTLDFLLLFGDFVILLLLNNSGIINLSLGITELIIVLVLGLSYIVFSIIKGRIELCRFQNLVDTVIVKTQDNITILKNLAWIDKETLAQYIDNILDERNKNEFEYIDYKNCKLVKETKSYFEYIGEKNGSSSRFKIYKIYFNINYLNKEKN